MIRKLKFYIIGLIPGVLLVFFILNQKGASCSGYLPNSRVIAETLSKDFVFTPQVKAQLQTLNKDEKFVKDSIIAKGKIDFDRSKAQEKPCPNYVVIYPEKNPKYELTYKKCDKEVEVLDLKTLK